MKPLRGVCPELSGALKDLSDDELRMLVTQIILDTAPEFTQIPEVEEYYSNLRAGGSLSEADPQQLHDLYESLEQRELEIAEVGGSDNERDKYFAMGRYVYALSLAAGKLDVEQVDSLLYDMAHAFDDQDLFWNEAIQKIKALVDKRS